MVSVNAQAQTKVLAQVKVPTQPDNCTGWLSHASVRGFIKNNPTSTITFNVKHMPLQTALSIVTKGTGIQTKLQGNANTKLTMTLNNTSWHEALVQICKKQNLSLKMLNNTLLISQPRVSNTKKTGSKRTTQTSRTNINNKRAPEKPESHQAKQLHSQYIRLSYAKAKDLANMINAAPSKMNVGQAGTAYISEYGSLIVDTRTNSLMIHDTKENIAKIQELIRYVDVPMQQVMIEVKVVRASSNFGKELGIRWGASIGGNTGSQNSPSLQTNSSASSQSFNKKSLHIDLGVSNPSASRFNFALLDVPQRMLDLEISALQAQGQGEIVSTPTILTTDNQTATIASGTQIPFSRYNTETSEISFIKAELSLQVTPSITPSGKVSLQLKIHSDTPGAVQSNGVMAINTNRIDTNVMVDNGQTVVLGGILQNQNSTHVSKTPVLGDVPVVGNLFKRTTANANNQQLLVFVTPRLVVDTNNHVPIVFAD